MASEGHSRPLLPETFVNPNTIQYARPTEIQHTDTRVYKRRWYILGLFTLLAVYSNILWNTWGPIQETCRLVFGWTNQSVLIIGMLSSGGYLLGAFPAAWIVKTQGLRLATLLTVGIQVLSVALLILPCNDQVKTYLIYATSGLVAFVSVIVQNVGVLVVSATWFPPTERTMATSIIFLLGVLGTASSYIIGPYIVPDVGTYKHGHKIDIDKLRNETSPERVAYLRWTIQEFIYVQAGVVAFLFLCVAVYFPAKPPRPPSVTASARRLDLVTGLKSFVRNKNLLLLLLIVSVSNGVQWGWIYVMDMILSVVGIDQKTAGWIGFGARIFVFPGILFSWYADRFKRYTKPAMMLLFFLSALCTAVYSLACEQVIPLSKQILFAMAMLQYTFFSGTIPLTQELAAECAYPIHEGFVNAAFISTSTIVNFLFYVVFNFLDTNPLWMNWVMVGAYFMCVPLVFVYHGQRKRLDADTGRKEYVIDNE